MYGDFSRLTFAPAKHRTRVLQQQGRVLCDADWNEQTDIMLHLLRELAADLIGPHGGPESNCGFAVFINTKDVADDPPGRKEQVEKLLKRGSFVIGRGRYYVDGILCENPTDVHVGDQALGTFDEKELTKDGTYLVYLDVWDEFVAPVQDASMVEVALGGLDTAARTKAAWAVKVQPIADDVKLDPTPEAVAETREEWEALVDVWQPANRGLLSARAIAPPSEDVAACSIDPESRFRGAENQLYRVEIHRGGVAWPSDADAAGGKKPKAASGAAEPARATFKFSRVNGSAVFAIEQLEGNEATLRSWPRETLQVKDWVEVRDRDIEHRGGPGPLRRVSAVDLQGRRVTLEPAKDDADTVSTDASKYAFLRRWDGISNVVEGDKWIKLEDGIEIMFAKAAASAQHTYRSGDYWLIPARVVTGDVDWPRTDDKPDALPPAGVTHGYAPLAILTRKGDKLQKLPRRRQFEPLAQTVADA